jgi:hypothetical protein
LRISKKENVMNNQRLPSYFVGLILLVVLFLTACGASQLAPTAVPPTLSPVPPKATLAPLPRTATVIPTKITRLNPSGRAYTSMAFDSESQRVILFGGQTGDYQRSSSYNGETWAFDVTTHEWTQMKPPSGPTPRIAAELVYDAESDRVIMYGGGLGPVSITWGVNSTWAYDYNTNTWKEMAKGPASHFGARLAYDAESDRIILFGGYNMSGNFYYNDTWSYDFNTDTWTEMKPSTSPPGRNYHAMTYDAKSDRVLIWGGSDVDGVKPVDDGSIWSYDYNTNTWTETKPGTGAFPAMRDYPQIVYDTKADRTILYGGISIGDGGTDDKIWAYEYKTNTWTKLEPSIGPGLLSRHTMLYNNAADQVILFGGQIGPNAEDYNYTDATWIYDFNTNNWTNVTSKP